MTSFQRTSPFDENAILGADSRSHHDRCRSRQPQRARTSDDDDRNAQFQANHEFTGPLFVEDGREVGEGIGYDHPAEEGDQAEGDDDRDEVSSDRVGEGLNGRFRSLRFLDEMDDLRQGGVLPSSSDEHVERSRAIDCSSDNVRPRHFIHGNSLPRNHALVDDGRSPQQSPIGRNFIPRHDLDRITYLDKLRRYLLLDGTYWRVGVECGLTRREGHEFTQSRTRFPLGEIFEIATKRDEGNEHSRRFKEDFGVVERVGGKGSEEHGGDGVSEGGTRAEHHEDVHGRGTMTDGSESGFVERPADSKLDWDGEEEAGEVPQIDSGEEAKVDEGAEEGDHRKDHGEEEDGDS